MFAFIMDIPTNNSPRLSPVLLAGIALSSLPPVLLQPFLDAAMVVMSRCLKGNSTAMPCFSNAISSSRAIRKRW